MMPKVNRFCYSYRLSRRSAAASKADSLCATKPDSSSCCQHENRATEYAQDATAALMIQENWDKNVRQDMIDLLRKLIPRGIWQHDAKDGNGDSHLKSGLVGPSEIIPLIDGRLGLSTWQNIFFCEFDGPHRDRTVVCTILADGGTEP